MKWMGFAMLNPSYRTGQPYLLSSVSPEAHAREAARVLFLFKPDGLARFDRDFAGGHGGIAGGLRRSLGQAIKITQLLFCFPLGPAV
jgi:hypothetical protein